MKLVIPEVSLVVLAGPSGAGKSTFGRRWFAPFEVVSSDFCRGLVANDENDQSASGDAFGVLAEIVRRRLSRGLLTVVDATNTRREDRAGWVALAKAHDFLPVIVAFDLPASVCIERNRGRPDRRFGPEVIHRQRADLRRGIRDLGREGFRYVHHLRSVEAVHAVEIERSPSFTDRRADSGPFDVIGDVHGCYDELRDLLADLGYAVRPVDSPDGAPAFHVEPPSGRRAFFVGDLVDRGPGVAEVLALVMGMVEAGSALCVPGNHEVKLLKLLRGKNVRLSHGLQATVDQLAKVPETFSKRVAAFIDSLVSHYVLDGGRLVVAHAGMKEEYQGRASGRVREFALYGETTGETDEFGLPVRLDWARDYRGRAAVVYGHVAVERAEWVNNTICIDTGCVFGGRLTALRWPERELRSVPARQVWCESKKPLRGAAGVDAAPPPARGDELLSLTDVAGVLRVETRLAGLVTARAEHTAAALETMSRHAADPRWLVYLPPTMAPPATTAREGLLEHPDEAFAEYAAEGVAEVVCEEKHMGSRAVVILAKDPGAARTKFGVDDGRAGVVLTRTGRPFFREADLEAALVARVVAAAEAAGLFAELATDWLVLDAELMPWSAKARDLLVHQYAKAGAAARHGLAEAAKLLEFAAARDGEAGGPAADLLARIRSRAGMAAAYGYAYRRYCWPTEGLEGLKLAPFHVLASEGAVHHEKDHRWHLDLAARLAATGDPVLMVTDHRVVNLVDEGSRAAAAAWWEEITEAGGEGLVVKPAAFTVRGRRGVVQPALKCRGREYLRIIYGPEYTAEEHLPRLRSRGLAGKRSLARREYALGIEALLRFTEGAPLHKIHECVFAIQALESTPADPRL